MEGKEVGRARETVLTTALLKGERQTSRRGSVIVDLTAVYVQLLKRLSWLLGWKPVMSVRLPGS